MTFEEATDIILGVFKTAWDPLGYPAVYEGISAGVPQTQTIWARPTIRHSIGFMASLRACDGSKRNTQEGTVFIQVFAPVGNGIVAAYNAAQPVWNAYIDSKNPSVWFKNIRINEMGRDGAFQEVQVHADFTYDIVR